MIHVPVHPKNAQMSRGQGSVQDSQAFTVLNRAAFEHRNIVMLEPVSSREGKNCKLHHTNTFFYSCVLSTL